MRNEISSKHSAGMLHVHNNVVLLRGQFIKHYYNFSHNNVIAVIITTDNNVCIMAVIAIITVTFMSLEISMINIPWNHWVKDH